ncbi:hypothetical protein [Dyadobacter sp. 32]|uniref:hypothetical protein n=1 Tax=Dyadobacter sp. 32 TaxID=538966 RepID=UPI0011EC0C31
MGTVSLSVVEDSLSGGAVSLSVVEDSLSGGIVSLSVVEDRATMPALILSLTKYDPGGPVRSVLRIGRMVSPHFDSAQCDRLASSV